MTECVATVVEWFRNNYSSLTLHTETFKDNTPSIQVLLHNKFTQFNEDEKKIFLKVEPQTTFSVKSAKSVCSNQTSVKSVKSVY